MPPRPPEIAPGPPLQQIDRTSVLYEGRKLAYFGGCDYFRLSSHPRVQQACVEGLHRYGLNVAASRLTTGNHRSYQELERRIAEFFEVESATLVSTGYVANSVAAQALASRFSHAFLDHDSHASLADAAVLLKAKVVRFERANAADLRRRLRAARNCRRAVVLSEGLFGHNGNVAPLRDYLAVLPQSAMLFVDDAHGAGVLGETGKGTVEELKLPVERTVRAVTLSKAFGVYGGAVLGGRQLQKRIYASSSIFAGNTPLPLPLAAAALSSVDLLQRDVSMRKRLRENISRVKDALQVTGLLMGHPSAPILSIVPSGAKEVKKLRGELLKRGVYPSFIHYPGGPREGYFRFAISSEHNAGQLDALIDALGGRR